MEPLLIPVIAILMPLALVPTILILKHRHRRRQWEHLERMKAMETQLPVSVQHTIGGGAATAIGAGVPAVSVLGAFLSSLTLDTSDIHDPAAIHAIIWGCAVLVSLGAFITSFVLSLMQYRARKESDRRERRVCRYEAGV